MTNSSDNPIPPGSLARIDRSLIPTRFLYKGLDTSPRHGGLFQNRRLLSEKEDNPVFIVAQWRLLRPDLPEGQWVSFVATPREIGWTNSDRWERLDDDESR